MSLFADAEEWQLECAAQTWAGLAYGARSDPPALCLHGWLDNAGSLVPLVRRLSGRRYWLPDFPGHGWSGHRPEGSWYHFVDLVSDVMGLAGCLGLDRFDLIGHSMGGAIASLIAGAFPERIGKLVLIEAIGPMSRAPEHTPADLRKAVEARLAVADKQLKVHPDRDSAVRARMAANELSRTAAEHLVERALMPVAGGYVWRSDPRQTLPSPLRGTEEQWLAVLRAVQAPTQILLADPPTPYLSGPSADRRIEALRPLQLDRSPGGHHLHLEEAERVAPLIQAFLDQP